jgi:hypothetical protein
MKRALAGDIEVVQCMEPRDGTIVAPVRMMVPRLSHHARLGWGHAQPLLEGSAPLDTPNWERFPND